MTHDPPERGEPARTAWLEAAVLLVAFVALAVWSRGKWTDPVVDFGTELYVPWRMVEGDVLYRDLAYRNGPLSPTVDALLFRLFGVSIRTLVIANLAVLALACGLLHRLVRGACGALTATSASLVFLCVFGFSQYTRFGNFNWVTPYQHAQTHGVLLGLGLVCAWVEHARRGTLRWAALAGAALGAAFLTKVELFAPAAAVAVAGAWTARARPRALAAFALGASVPLVLFLALLAARMPFADALRGWLGNWVYLGGAVAGDPFYLRGAGLDDPLGNLARMGLAAAGLGAAGGLLWVADRRRSARGLRVPGYAAVGLVLMAAIVAPGFRMPEAWAAAARALPLVALASLVAYGAAASRAREPDERRRHASLALLALLALGLLAKMILATRIEHYGFALAMPAAVLAAVALVWGLPELLRRRGANGELARAVGLAAVAAGIAFHLALANRWYAWNDVEVGEGADRILASGRDDRGAMVARALDQLDTLVPSDGTLVVLPEGVSLNYWLRRPSSSRFTLFLPTELAAVGEETILADLSANPPDFVALVPRDMREWELGDFGTAGNGLAIGEWISANYTPLTSTGEPQEEEIVILRRDDG